MNIYPYISIRFSHCVLLKLQVLFIFIFFSLSVFSQEVQLDERLLVIGEKIERKVIGQELHGYVIELKRGQMLKMNFMEKGADVTAWVLRVNDKQKVSAITNLGKGFMKESLTLVADQDGVYELIVRTEQITDSKAEAKYELTATLDAQTNPKDLQRIQAEILAEDVLIILTNNDKEKLPLAITKLEESLKIWQLLGDRYRQAIDKWYIGISLLSLENFTKAEANFNEALNLFDRVNNKSEVGYVYAGLAGLYFTKKDEEKTRKYVTQALEIFNSLGDRRSELVFRNAELRNLADLGGYVGNDKLPNYDQEIKAAKLKKDSAAEASIWAKSVLIYAFESGGEENRTLFARAEREALPLIKQIKDKNAEMQILVGLGIGYSDLGEDETDEEKKSADLEKAKNYLIQGLSLSKILNNQIFETLAYAGLSVFYYGDNDKLAIFFGKKFINSMQSFRQSLKAVDKDTQQFIAKQAEDSYGEIASDLIFEGRLEEALQVINLGRDQEFFDFKLIDNQPFAKSVLTSREAENEPLFDNLVKEVTAKYANSLNTNYLSAANDLKIVFDKLEQNFNVDSSEKDIVKNVPDVVDMQAALRELSAKTGKKHTAIYYSDYDGVEILLITPDGITAFTGGGRNLFKEYDEYLSNEMPKFKAAGLSLEEAKEKANNKYKELQAEIAGEDSDEIIPEFLKDLTDLCRDEKLGFKPCFDARPVGSIIYKKIFKTQKLVNGNAENTTLKAELDKYKADVIHWSLAGKMRYVPIAALYDEESKQYLVEKYENVVFTRAGKDRFLSNPILWIKGVGFAATNVPGLELLGAEKEIATIFSDSIIKDKGYFNGQVFLNKDFTKQALLTIPQTKPAFIHIASHFTFEPGDAKNSFLLLGDGNTFSLLDMKQNLGLFEGVDLLTLSACQTAVQKTDATGKEIDGFAELAQRLGAKSVIATLWSVDDKGTSQLMAEFYRIRKENPDVATSEVLRIAQLSLLNGNTSWEDAMKRRINRGVGVGAKNKTAETKQERIRTTFNIDYNSPYEHPYYWAPFVYYGSSNGKKISNYILSKPASTPATNNTRDRIAGTNKTEAFRPSDLVGTWEGLFDQAQYACTLEIERVEGNTFFGTLKPQGALIAISGFIDIDTQQISFMETKIISLGNNSGWVLGNNRGTLSNDGKYISGTGVGGTSTYKWSFWKKGSNGLAGNFNSSPTSSIPRTTLNEIESSFKNNLFDETIRLARIFLQTLPNDKDANAYLGLSFLIKKDVDNAVPALEKAILLGQSMPFPMKRLREPILGHGLDNVNIVISTTGVAIVSGNTVYQARFSDLTESNLQNYKNQCGVIHLKGLFTESSTKSEKSKQDKKTFNLFPPSAYLQPTYQGNLVLNLAVCNYTENYLTTAVMTLMYRLAAR